MSATVHWVRLHRLPPSSRGEPRFEVHNHPHLHVEAMLAEDDRERVDGEYARLPHIAVWALVDTRRSPLQRGGNVVKAEDRLRDLREWMDEHLAEWLAEDLAEQVTS
jgi:hypothetical protein